MQNSTLVWIILAALLILGGGWYFLNSQNLSPADEPDIEEETSATPDAPGTGVAGDDSAVFGASSEESAAPMTAAVTYSASGFSPSIVTVKTGGSVTWTDQGTGKMWVATAQHPTHTTYDGTTLQEHCNAGTSDTFDQCKNNGTYSFTFDKAGTWRYHNHSGASHFGTVIVEE